jgi:hypothetical protein
MRKLVVLNGAPDCRCYRGQLVVGEVNRRRSPPSWRRGGTRCYRENSSRWRRANGVFEPLLGFGRRPNARNNPCEKLFRRLAAQATTLLQGVEANYLAMEVCNDTGLGHQRTPVLHFDFAGPVRIEDAGQRNEVGVAASFIDLYDDVDVPAAFVHV